MNEPAKHLVLNFSKDRKQGSGKYNLETMMAQQGMNGLRTDSSTFLCASWTDHSSNKVFFLS